MPRFLGVATALASVLLAGFVMLVVSWPAWAQNASGPCLCTAVTVGVTSTQAIASHQRQQLALDNESTSATIACSFGGTAAINTAGSFTIPPGLTRSWSGPNVPSDAINCIASAGSTPLTVEE